MKNIKKYFVRIVLVLFFAMMTSALMAADPPGPPPPDGPGSGGGVLPGGGAPIGDGSLIFIALAAVYGIKKVYQMTVLKELEE